MGKYQELREIALENNASLGADFPCKRGKGNCCEPNIFVCEADMQNITRGIKKGNIPQETVTRAIKKAQDPNRESCPFLSEDRECTIYEQRPLICAVAGTSGLPGSQSLFEAALYESIRVGYDVGISAKDLSIVACEDCYRCLVGQKARFSLTSIKDYSDTYEYLGRQPFTRMEDFILNRLTKTASKS